MTSEFITDLEGLRDEMIARSPRVMQGDDWRTDLPTFGGDEPQDTWGIWSWDATRLLVGECAEELEIVDRDDGFDDLDAVVTHRTAEGDAYAEKCRQAGIDSGSVIAPRGVSHGCPECGEEIGPEGYCQQHPDSIVISYID